MATSIEGLNLVLLGKIGAGKSASGNTILQRQMFITKKSSRSVTQDVAVESGTVCELPVTVYDTPGFCDTDIREEEIHLKYQSIFQKCESGPSAFLLVIKADRFTEEERKTVEKIEELLGDKRLKKTWILFTRGDELEDENTTIKEFIDETESLKKLLKKYDQRYHVFNNKSKNPGQVQGLFIKIFKLCFDNQEGEAEILIKNPLMRKKTTDFKQHTPVSSLLSRRIVLLGQTGVGKSAAGNTILGQREFISVMRISSVTRECSDAHATVSGRSVSVVDTPGFFDTHMNPEELMKEIARSVYLSSPGPHAFLIVFPVNTRFTDREQQILQIIEMIFGEEVLKYSIILFTHGDLLEEKPIEELIKQNCRLRDLVGQCGGRFYVFNNKDQNNREQVNDLLQKIDTMIEKNGGGHYSNEMFEDAQRFRREEEEERKQVEKQRQEEIERVRKETEERVRAEFEAAYERFKTERLNVEEQRKQAEEQRKEFERDMKKTEERVRAEYEDKAERESEEEERIKPWFNVSRIKRHFTKPHFWVTAGTITGAIIAAPAVVVAAPFIGVGAAAAAAAAAGALYGAAAAGALATADDAQREQRREEERKQQKKKK